MGGKQTSYCSKCSSSFEKGVNTESAHREVRCNLPHAFHNIIQQLLRQFSARMRVFLFVGGYSLKTFAWNNNNSPHIRGQFEELIQVYNDDTYQEKIKEKNFPAKFVELLRSAATLGYDDINDLYKQYADIPKTGASADQKKYR
ncbi:hypothetical protein AVEN_26623-1 [Araneus ventricosus]|uniref:Uncharacterized protein n=1 Tax=Araneus ventricosus TaxID=182803 RepID=A0A4Y2X0G1_ARAVE|nr:hypothetical protein AVEN_26623-1 [Araneus ventricosus]